MTKSLTKRIAAVVIALCLLFVGVCSLTACGGDKVEGTYTVSQVTVAQEGGTKTVTAEEYEKMTDTEKNSYKMYFEMEVTLEKDGKGKFKMEGQESNATWEKDGDKIKFTVGEGEQTQTYDATYEDETLTVTVKPVTDVTLTIVFEKK